MIIDEESESYDPKIATANAIQDSEILKNYLNKEGLEVNDISAINEIRKNKIDIIIDIMGITSSSRISLFKNRLAPTQISWLGYCNTTGLNEVDYIIADSNLINKEEEDLYSEKVIFLPNIWNCHSGFNIERKLPDINIKNHKHITFGSFNNFNKISDEVVDIMNEILKKIDKSRLLLKC